MGAKFVTSSLTERYEYERQRAMGYDLRFNAGASVFTWGARAGSSVTAGTSSHDNGVADTFGSRTYTIGSELPGGDSVEEQLTRWVANKEAILKNPQPVANYELAPVQEYVEKALSTEGWDPKVIQGIKARMTTLVADPYCDRLKKRGELTSCGEPSSGTPVEPYSEPLMPEVKSGRYGHQL